MELNKWIVGTISGLALAGLLAVSLPAAFADVGSTQTQTPVTTNTQKCTWGQRVFSGGLCTNIDKFLGINAQTLMTERQSGKSLVQIAKAQGKSETDLYNYLYNQAKTSVDKMVTNGKLTQAQADQRLTKTGQVITKEINSTPFQDKRFGGKLANIGKFLGINAQTLMTERQSGKSLVQIAKAQGKSETDLYNYLYNQAKTSVDKMVTNGKLTQTQADQRLTKTGQVITKEINSTTFQAKARGQFGMKCHGQRGQMNKSNTATN